jgi:hypothetical protein
VQQNQRIQRDGQWQRQQQNQRGDYNRGNRNQSSQQWRQWQQQNNSRWQQRQTLDKQRYRILEQQRRLAQLRYEQRYWERLRRDQMRLQSWQYNNYVNNYRYNRGGSYYYTNQYGAQMLQRAINDGYSEGFQAGRADRQDGWSFDYNNAFGYQDASYGYDGYYVGMGEYQHYFREGFRRGYEDGYYSRYRYGRYSNGGYSILGNILSGILQVVISNNNNDDYDDRYNNDDRYNDNDRYDNNDDRYDDNDNRYNDEEDEDGN